MLLNRTVRNGNVAALLLAVLAAPVAAKKPMPSPYSLTAELKDAGFSGVVYVADRGRVLVHRPFGLADRSFAVPVGLDTRFRIASITKLFTAVLVLQLVEERRVDLDKPFMSYLPSYPGPGAQKITVRQLLGHMSGLPQFDTVASIDQAVREGLPQYQRLRSPRQLLELCCTAAPASPPGERFDYNNADYIVLGQLIEAVTGKSYTTILDRRLLRPLRLNDTAMSSWDRLIPRLAPTYMRNSTGRDFNNDLPIFWENGYAAGGLYSDLDDVVRFSDALFSGRLLRPVSVTAVLRPAGDEYGLGLWSYDFKRKGVTYRVAKRPGSIMGATTMLYRLPGRGVSIVILANSNAVDLDRLAQRLAEAVIDGRPIQ